MNVVSSFPGSPDSYGKLPLLYVEERDGHIAAFTFRGDARHVGQVLKMWAGGKLVFDPMENAARCTAIMSNDKMIATVTRNSMHRHWYMIRLTDNA